MLYQNVKERFRAWVLGHKSMQQYESEAISASVVSFAEKMKQDEERIRSLYKKMREIEEQMNSRDEELKNSINDFKAQHELAINQVRQLQNEILGFAEIFNESSKRKRLKLVNELEQLNTQMVQLSFWSYSRNLQAAVRNYPENAELKEMLEQTKPDQLSIMQTKRQLDAMKEDIRRIRSRKSGRTVLWWLFGIFFAMIAGYVGLMIYLFAMYNV